MSLGVGGSGPTALGLDVGTATDTLALAGAVTTNGTVNLSIGAAPGFGSTPSYTLLSAGNGLSGATYAINGSVPGGYTYSLTTSDTEVILNGTPTSGGTFFWTGDQSGSWSTYNSGNTNWEDGGGNDTASTPGPLDKVVFSSLLGSPSTSFVTTLNLPVAIDSLLFNAATSSTQAVSVGIATGVGGSTLTLAPANPGDGIVLQNFGGFGAIASISAPIVLAADQTWTVGSAGVVRPDLIVTGVLSGTGNLVKTGAGTATITGNNTRTGRTVIEEGTLRINAEAALGANPASPSADQLTLDGSTARLAFTASTVINDPNRGITLGVGGGSFDTTGGNGTIDSVIGGAGGLRKVGTGTLILNGANTYTGGTTIGASVIRLGSDTALGTGPLTVNGAGTIVELASGVTVGNDVTVAEQGNDKTFRLIAGATFATLTGDISVAESTVGSFRAQASAGSTLNFTGDISSVGTVASGLRVNELAGTTGVVVLAGANTYAGVTEVRGGTLRNGASEVIPGALTVNAFVVGAATPSTATYDLASHSETVSALTFGAVTSTNAANVNIVAGTTGTLTLDGNVTTIAGHPNARAELQPNVVMAATRTFSVADAANEAVDLVVAGVLSGPGAVTKAGLGTMKIRGQALYTGVTTVSAGVLLVEGSISGAVNVAGGKLGGTGSVGAINATSGTVAPGESIGTLTAASLTMTGGPSVFQLEINTTNQTHDLLSSSGPVALSLAGTPLTLADLGANLALTDGARIRFITYSGGQSGFFSVGGNLIDDDIESFVFGANTFTIDYNDLGGTAVSLVVVPEPSIAGSLLAGVALLAGLRGRRRRGAAR